MRIAYKIIGLIKIVSAVVVSENVTIPPASVQSKLEYPPIPLLKLELLKTGVFHAL